MKTDLASVYFLGIGGIGMSALARYFHAQGVRVSGYDRTSTPLTEALIREGIPVHFTDDPSLIPDDPDLVVYTPAVPASLAEKQEIDRRGIRCMKRAEVLGLISQRHPCIAVAGTHGKTSTSSMTATLLDQCGIPMIAFMGGIARNFDSNLHLADNPQFMVAEADEFDRSFHHLHPRIAIVTSTDADHLDIYGDYQHLIEAFLTFIGQVQDDGIVLIRQGLSLISSYTAKAKLRTYSAWEDADYQALNVHVADGAIRFDLKTPVNLIPGFELRVPGRINVENAVAALAACLEAGADPSLLLEALPEYRGVQRRFDIRFRNSSMVYMDDYAHHPGEIRACIESARLMWPDQYLTGIFQPHLYTRTRDFADEFAESLDLLDCCYLLDIYPAREEAIPGVRSEMILERMKNPNAKCIPDEDVPSVVAGIPDGVLLTLGAGDIDQLVHPVCERLKNRYSTL